MRWLACTAAVAVLGNAAACSDKTGATADAAGTLPDTVAAFDTKSAETATDATAAPDWSADAAAKPDSSAEVAAETVAEVAPDVTADAAADIAPDVVAEVAPDSAADIAPDVAADTAADVAADAAAPMDALADAAAEVVPTKDAAAETAAVDTAVADAIAPAACTPGQLKRCWVECAQSYVSTCISGQTPILIMGTQACTAGQWAACTTMAKCGDYATGPCTNGSKAPQKYLCTDGTTQTGAHICTKPLGANCTTSYYINWPIYDCPLICKGPDDTCAKDGDERACEVHCGDVSGETKPGKQKCQNVCDGLFWNMCQTGEACK